MNLYYIKTMILLQYALRILYKKNSVQSSTQSKLYFILYVKKYIIFHEVINIKK